MNAKDIPCRATAELNQHLRLVEKADARRFDPWDDGLMRDMFGDRMAPVLAELLIKLEQIDKINASFGADKEKSYDFLIPTLYKLRDACGAEFKQL